MNFIAAFFLVLIVSSDEAITIPMQSEQHCEEARKTIKGISNMRTVCVSTGFQTGI